MKRLLLLLATLLLSGCASGVDFTIADNFEASKPKVVLVEEPVWADEGSQANEEMRALYKKLVMDRLDYLGYEVMEFQGKPTDTSVMLRTKIVYWDPDSYPGYSGLYTEAHFELVTMDGVSLWSAGYASSEFALGMDSDALDAAIIWAYEPVVDRIVASAFTTLPRGNVEPGSKKGGYYKWLP